MADKELIVNFISQMMKDQFDQLIHSTGMGLHKTGFITDEIAAHSTALKIIPEFADIKLAKDFKDNISSKDIFVDHSTNRPHLFDDKVYMRIPKGNWTKEKVYSFKLINIFVDFTKLMSFIAKNSLAIIGVVSNPWTAPLVALVIWESVVTHSKIEISEHDAATMWILWNNRTDEGIVPCENLLELINNELTANHRSPISQKELNVILEKLTELKCIRRGDDEKQWVITEKVQI